MIFELINFIYFVHRPSQHFPNILLGEPHKIIVHMPRKPNVQKPKTKNQFVARVDSSSFVYCRDKNSRDNSGHIWKFSLYFKIFICLFNKFLRNP